MLNKIYLTGNLGQAPRFFKTQDGQDLAVLSVATNFSWKRDDGEWQTHTDWHRVMVFKESLISWMKGALKKGDSLLIEGKLSYTEIGTGSEARKVACIVISGREGQVHFLRSGRKDQNEKASDLQMSLPLEGEPDHATS